MTNKTFEDWWNKYGEFPDNRYMCQEIFEAGQRECAKRCLEIIFKNHSCPNSVRQIKKEFLDNAKS